MIVFCQNSTAIYYIQEHVIVAKVQCLTYHKQGMDLSPLITVPSEQPALYTKDSRGNSILETAGGGPQEVRQDDMVAALGVA
ncbi:hypothetical protein BG000_005840 [Podila horticola]|nr:hypothetical protein BG000_005840 [Podila horticola]